MKIGLVLPDVPQYSETFFNFKINGLIESGFEVVIFSGIKSKSNFSFSEKVKVIHSYPVRSRNIFIQIFLYGYVLAKTFVFSLSRTVKLFKLETKDGNSFSNCIKSVYLNAHILRENIDVLHFGFTTMALKRENVAKSIDAKMSVSFRGYDINIYPLKNPGCYKKVWENTDKVHTISEYLRDKAVVMGLPAKTPFMKITPAVEFEKIKLPNLRENISNPIILTVGRLNWIKNYETPISAMKLLSDEGVIFNYKIIGEGPELERLKFAVYQYGLEDKIDFAGKKSHEEVLDMMSCADIYLQPSYEEGFCVSVLEAQAAGLMCIVSDAEGLKENVVDGETGWIIPVRDFRKLKQKITDVVRLSYEERKVISETARQRIMKEFRIEDQNRKFREFFQKLNHQNG